MVRAALVAAVTLAVVPQALSYRPAPGAPRPIEGEFTYNFEITGPDALVKQLVASNPVLSIKEIRSTRKGTITSTVGGGNTSHIELIFDSAQVNGVAAGKPFTFDFVRTRPLASTDLSTDAARVVSWGRAMGRRDYLLGPKGDYTLVAGDQDAQGEASAILLDGAVRLAAKPVNVGETWTTNWTGKRKQKNNDGTFAYQQTARLDQLTDGPKPTARISFSTRGTLNIPAAKNPQGETTALEGKGYIVLDVAKGQLLACESGGAITTEIKQAGLKMVQRMSARFKAP
jgi:hypothetical protein